MATIKDVARLAGVGLGTASRAISGRGPVSEKALAKVNEAVATLDFRPSNIARALSTKTLGMIGVYVPDFSGTFYGPILKDNRTSPLSRITRYFAGLADFHERRQYAFGCLIGNMALEVTPSSEEVRAKLAAIYREWSTSLADCMREAQVRKELAPGRDASQLAAALIDTFEGAVMRAKVERSRAPFDSFERCVLPCLLA